MFCCFQLHILNAIIALHPPYYLLIILEINSIIIDQATEQYIGYQTQ